MRTNVGKNYIFNMMYQIMLIIIPLITTPYISRVLGADGVGIYNYTYSVVTMFTLFAVLGTNSFAIREIAYNQNNRIVCSRIFYEVFSIRCVMTMLLIPIYLSMVFISGKYTFVYIASLTYLISVPLDISWFFQGLEEFKKTIITSAVVRIVSTILLFVCVQSENDIAIYTLILGSSGLIGYIFLWFFLPQYAAGFDFRHFHPMKHIKPVLMFFIPAVSTYIYTSLDKVVLGLLSSEAEVGYYSQSEKIIKLLITVIVSLSMVLMPRMANLIRSGKMGEVKKNLNISYEYVLLVSIPMMVGLFAVTDYFVPLFFGDGYEKCIIVMKVLIPLVIIMGLSSMTGTTVMIAMGKQKQYIIIIISASIINLLLNILLVKKFSSIGVAVATIVAELFVTFMEMYAIRDLIEKKSLLYSLIRYVVATLVMYFVIMIMKMKMPCNWESIIVMVIAGIITYATFLLIKKDRVIIKIFATLKKMLLH